MVLFVVQTEEELLLLFFSANSECNSAPTGYKQQHIYLEHWKRYTCLYTEEGSEI